MLTVANRVVVKCDCLRHIICERLKSTPRLSKNYDQRKWNKVLRMNMKTSLFGAWQMWSFFLCYGEFRAVTVISRNNAWRTRSWFSLVGSVKNFKSNVPSVYVPLWFLFLLEHCGFACDILDWRAILGESNTLGSPGRRQVRKSDNHCRSHYCRCIATFPHRETIISLGACGDFLTLQSDHYCTFDRHPRSYPFWKVRSHDVCGWVDWGLHKWRSPKRTSVVAGLTRQPCVHVMVSLSSFCYWRSRPLFRETIKL